VLLFASHTEALLAAQKSGVEWQVVSLGTLDKVMS